MKVTFLDFFLSSIIMSLLALATSLVVFYGIIPFTAQLPQYAAIFDVLSFLFIYGIFAGLVVRCLVMFFPVPSGEFDMNSWVFTEFKLLAMVADTGFWALRPFKFLALTPVFLILFGARVGKNLGSGGNIVDPYMVRIGNNVIIGNGSEICGNYTQNGKIQLGYINIGNNVTIGMHATILPNVSIGDNATVCIGSVVMPGTIIPPGETWRGNPARKWQ